MPYANESKPEGKKKTLAVYVVREVNAKEGHEDEKKDFWTRVGTMVPHASGEGFTIFLDALPIDGRLVARPPKSDSERQAA